jgi:thymidylate synthase ThyX
VTPPSGEQQAPTFVTPLEDDVELCGCNPAHSTAEVDATLYRRIIGNLHYLVHTGLDLAFAVEYVSRFMERPTVEHLQVK